MHEEHITLCQAAQRSPGRPSANAVWRWCRRGVKSRSGVQVRLEHIRDGGKIFTTPESLDRFFTAVAAADAEHFGRSDGDTPLPHNRPSDSPHSSGSQRRRLIQQAEQILDQAGI